MEIDRIGGVTFGGSRMRSGGQSAAEKNTPTRRPVPDEPFTDPEDTYEPSSEAEEAAVDGGEHRQRSRPEVEDDEEETPGLDLTV